MERIFSEIRKHTELSDETERLLASKLTEVRFARREQLVKEGFRVGAAFFIELGITRSFWLVDGEEITTSFSTEGALVFSMDEIYYSQPSQEYVEAIEELLVYKIKADDLRTLVRENLELSRWWGAIHQKEYRRLHQSHKERLSLSARERYEAFRRQFPDVCRRVKKGQIASYLGISLSTLSRISGDLI